MAINTENSCFNIELTVRDYECDIQGIVNNAIYQNYFEHARHEYLKSHGFDFHDITKSGIFLVIYRAEIDYCLPLRSGDKFRVTVSLTSHSKTRCTFEQSILVGDDKYTEGKFYITGLNSQRRPVKLETIGISTLFKEQP